MPFPESEWTSPDPSPVATPEAQWGSILEATQDATWYFDFRTGRTQLNDRWFDMLGYTRGELEETPGGWMALIHPEDLPRVQADMDAHLAGRTPQFMNEHRLRTKTGEWKWVLDRGKVVSFSPDGKPLVAAGTHTDITARKQAELALLASEARFKALADLVPMGIWLSEQERGCTYVNQGWGTFTGRAPESGLGDGWTEALHPEDRERAFATWQEAAQAGKGFDTECRFVKPDQEERWGLVMVRPWQDPTGGPGGHLGVVLDITERKAGEAAQARQMRALSDLKFALDQAAIVALTDAQGVILEANDRFQAISKYSREELVGRTHRILKSGHHPKEFFEAMWATIRRGRVWHGEIQNRAKDGSTYWVDTTIIPLLGPDGVPERYLAIRFDISERHRIQEALQAARQAALEAVRTKDQFVAFIGHEFRNALSSLLGFADLLALPASGPLSERQRGYVDHLTHSGQHLLRLVGDLLDLARLEQGHLAIQPEPVAVLPALEALKDTLAPLAQVRGVHLFVEPGGPGFIHVDPTRLEQVLVNLGSNAVKYNRSGGLIVLRARTTERGWCRLEVEDSGPGIPLELQPRVFQPFDRLDREGTDIQGTGLGLSLSKRLVEDMGGHLDFHSTPGTGSVFWVEFPGS